MIFIHMRINTLMQQKSLGGGVVLTQIHEIGLYVVFIR